EVTRAILARTLRGAGFEVIEARDGLEGAVLALRERPAVVVTDLEMPTLDGFPFLRLLKAEPSSAHIPVLILTHHGEAASSFWRRRPAAAPNDPRSHPATAQPEALKGVGKRGTAPATADTSATPAGTPSPAAPEKPVGPLDVLARVARQLDASLLQAT